MIFTTLVLVTCLFAVVSAQTQATFAIYANSSDIYPLPSSADCANALSAQLQCNSTIAFTIPGSTSPLPNLTSSDLSSLCTPSCYTSLTNAIATIDTSCSGWPFILGDTSYIPSFPCVYILECKMKNILMRTLAEFAGFSIILTWYFNRLNFDIVLI
jgi:hypothetical protein